MLASYIDVMSILYLCNVHFQSTRVLIRDNMVLWRTMAKHSPCKDAVASWTMTFFNNLHVIDSPSCTCRAQCENVKHFFLYCPQFNVIICHLIGNIQVVMSIDIDYIRFGNPDYDVESNKRVFLRLYPSILLIHRDLSSNLVIITCF